MNETEYTTILPEQSFTTMFLEAAGCFLMDVDAPSEALVIGQEYTVRFDGVEYTCVCFDASAVIPNTVGLGNGTPLGLPGNGEPFAVQWTAGQEQITVFCFYDTQPTEHTVSIYNATTEEPETPEEPENPAINSNDAVLLSYSQNPVVYNNIPKVWLTHPDSTDEDVKLVPFTYGEAVSKSVTPDFANGDMSVEIPDGELVTELTVVKPENLVPENIAEGVNIAGTVGALAAGGSTKVAYGEFTGNGASVTLEHGLGVTPDIFFVRSKNSKSGITFLSRLVGMSTAFKTKCEWAQPQMLVCYNNGAVDVRGITLGIDTDNVACPASNANSDSIVVGASAYPLYNGFTYAWTAIGGLT